MTSANSTSQREVYVGEEELRPWQKILCLVAGLTLSIAAVIAVSVCVSRPQAREQAQALTVLGMVLTGVIYGVHRIIVAMPTWVL